MAGAANFDREFLAGRTDGKAPAAGTGGSCLCNVFRVDISLHGRTIAYKYSGAQLQLFAVRHLQI